jgi:hypothetical protein
MREAPRGSRWSPTFTAGWGSPAPARAGTTPSHLPLHEPVPHGTGHLLSRPPLASVAMHAALGIDAFTSQAPGGWPPAPCSTAPSPLPGGWGVAARVASPNEEHREPSGQAPVSWWNTSPPLASTWRSILAMRPRNSRCGKWCLRRVSLGNVRPEPRAQVPVGSQLTPTRLQNPAAHPPMNRGRAPGEGFHVEHAATIGAQAEVRGHHQLPTFHVAPCSGNVPSPAAHRTPEPPRAHGRCRFRVPRGTSPCQPWLEAPAHPMSARTSHHLVSRPPGSRSAVPRTSTLVRMCWEHLTPHEHHGTPPHPSHRGSLLTFHVAGRHVRSRVPWTTISATSMSPAPAHAEAAGGSPAPSHVPGLRSGGCIQVPPFPRGTLRGAALSASAA